MWKKIFLSVSLIIIFIVGIEIFNISKKNEEDTNNIIQNETELSTGYVTDECLNEWTDYSSIAQAEIQETNQNLNDKDRHYILKSENDVIKVYYINEKEEEILYKVTEIYTKYLSENDIKELETGIDVYGVQELNQLLEDFE